MGLWFGRVTVLGEVGFCFVFSDWNWGTGAKCRLSMALRSAQVPSHPEICQWQNSEMEPPRQTWCLSWRPPLSRQTRFFPVHVAQCTHHCPWTCLACSALKPVQVPIASTGSVLPSTHAWPSTTLLTDKTLLRPHPLLLCRLATPCPTTCLYQSSECLRSPVQYLFVCSPASA